MTEPELESIESKTLILVDDNKDIQTVVALSLKKVGFKIVVFGTGQAALDAMDEVQPDIVVVDQGLPDMSGIELGTRIRMSPGGKTIALVMFTGSLLRETHQLAKEAGFDDFLVKPIRMQNLRERLLALLTISDLPNNPPQET